jgi:membrane fusion protein, heavy metal efflux system
MKSNQFPAFVSNPARPVVWVSMGVLAALLLGCDAKAPDDAVAKTSAGQTAIAKDPMLINVTPEQQANFKTGKVEMFDLAVVQEHPGRIEANEKLVSRIGSSVTGRVTTVLAYLGERVSPGQTLAQVSSPELTTSQLAYLRANANQSMAERGVDRARQLIAADVIGSAELQRRETELSIARAELRAAEDQLRLIGLPTSAIEKLRTQGSLHAESGVIARISGVVVERKVSQGQVVQPGDQLFTVADLSNVWVVGSLPEQAAQSVQQGQTVEIEVPAINQKFTGKVIFISDTVQPETRTVTVRSQVDNPKRELKPQMLANMRIAGMTKKMPAIPVSALIRQNDQDYLFVMTAPNTYRLTAVELGPIKLGSMSQQLRPVLKGVSEGETIITDGGFHLNNDRIQRLLTSSSGQTKSEPGVSK